MKQMKYMNRALCLIVCAAVLVMTGCSSADLPATDETLLRFLPEDTSGIVFVDLSGLRENPFAQDFIDEHVGVQVPEALDDFTASTGFDPNSSLRQIMAASAGDSESLMVVSAVYDRARVSEYLTEEGMTFGSHEGVGLFRPDPAREALVAFVDDVILVGSESQVRGAIDRSSGTLRSALNNPRLLEDIRTIGEGYQVWATGRIDPNLIPEELTGMGPVELIRSIERGTYQMRVDEMVTARAIGEFTDPGQASTVASLLEGLKGIAMLQGASGDFSELLSAILISNEESVLEIELQIETALLERLAESGALTR